MKDVLIKWTGSKRLQSKCIIKSFPDHINTYYEPFLGSGAMLYSLLTSNKKVDNYVGSDNNEHLINIWLCVQKTPDLLCQQYEELWHELKKEGQQLYFKVRKRFNAVKSPGDFFFLLRTCRNGLVRFNSKGYFNVCYHYGRSGAKPKNIADIIQSWSKLLQKVTIIHQDYQQITTEEDDFIYADPPYASPTNGQFYNSILNYEYFWSWLEKQRGSYAFSLDGLQGQENISIDVPINLYSQHLLIPGGSNRLNQDISKRQTIYDSLYIK